MRSRSRLRNAAVLAAVLAAALAGACAPQQAGVRAADGPAAAATAPTPGQTGAAPAPAADAAVVATVDGAPITAGLVREIMRVTGAGPAGATAALDRAIESQLLYAEGVRRGLREDPAVVAELARDTERLLIEQYALSLHRAELKAKDPGAFHSAAKLQGKHGGVMSEAAQLNDKIEAMEKEAYRTSQITMLPAVYQGQNLTPYPRGQLVVARFAGGGEVLWAEVEAIVPGVRGLEPPLQGLDALKFVGGIQKTVARKVLRRDAEAALPGFREEYERSSERLARAAVTRRLLALEVDPKVSLGEADLRAWYDAHPGRYGSGEAPQPFEQARPKVQLDAERDAKTRLRAELAGRLRSAAAVVIDLPLLESLGK